MDSNKPNELKKTRRRTKPFDKKEDLVDTELSSPWSIDDDIALVEGKTKFGPNWDLLSDIVGSIVRSVPKRRSRKQCFEHWHWVSQSKEMLPAPTSPPSEPPHFAILEVIKRTMQKKKQIPGRIGSVAQTENLVPVATHASHSQAAVSVGMGTKPRSPIEIATNAILKLQGIQNKQAPPSVLSAPANTVPLGYHIAL